MLILEIYCLLTYIGGAAFAIMTLKNDCKLTIGDAVLFLLSPFTVMPILVIQLISQLIDIETTIFRI